MQMTAELVSGFTAYTSTEELLVSAVAEAPALSTPILVFSAASSPECAALSIGVVSGAVSTTFAGGC